MIVTVSDKDCINHLVGGGHVPGLVLGHGAAEVAAPVLLRLLLVNHGCKEEEIQGCIRGNVWLFKLLILA